MLAEKKKKNTECCSTVNFLLGSTNGTLQLGYCFVRGFICYSCSKNVNFFLKRYHKSMCKVCATFTLKQQLSNSLHMVAYVY